MKKRIAADPFDADLQGFLAESRKMMTKICQTGMYHSYDLCLSVVWDLIADWTLFFVLLATNNPLLAALHGLSLLVQYFQLRSSRKQVLDMASRLDDPLEADGATINQEEIDKLFNGERAK